jgi:hypothetical protein
MHEDVHINIFKFSLEGTTHDWCRSLLDAIINSLTAFHAALNFFCKEYFSAENIYKQCCDEFSLLCKDFSFHENHTCYE